jgi:hypothetical protein
MTPAQTLTVVATVRDERLADMRTTTDRIAADVRDDASSPFGRMETVHYARWVLLEPTATPDGKERIPPELVFTTVYEKSLDEHLDELLHHGLDIVDSLYSLCEGYPAPDARTDATRKAYLRAHSVGTSTFYGAHDGRKLKRIRLESRLRSFLGEVVDARRDEWVAGGVSHADIQQELLRVVRQNSEFAKAAAYAADSGTWPRQRVVNLALAFLAALAALALLPVTLTLLVLWTVILRYHEMHDTSAKARRSPDHLDNLASNENLFPQNQITVMSWVKPGWFRHLTLRLVLFSANFTSRVLLWPKRVFFGLESIHYAQWIVIDGGRRLIFLSNFDGSWESYIGEFVDKAHIALTPIWTNCVGFPETSFLFFGGAGREAQFKELVRDNQIPTQIWYSAYPNLSVPNVNDASDINAGLHEGRGSSTKWLALV